MRRSPASSFARVAGCLATALVLAWPTAGAAEPVAGRLGYSIDAPATWAFDVERSNAVSRGLQAERHYDGLRTDVGADAYIGDRASLFVQWVHARDKLEGSARLELTMRRTFDQIRGAASAGELVAWREDVRRDLAEGNLEWKDAAGGTITLVRAFVFVTDDDLLRQVRAECVYAAAVPADRRRCNEALGSLALTEATGPRGSIGAVPGAGSLRMSQDTDTEAEIAVDDGAPATSSGTAPAQATAPDSPSDAAAGAPPPDPGSTDRLVLEAPTLDRAAGDGDGPPRVLYQAPKDAPRPANRTDQLITLIGGVLVAAAVYAMWRERRRKAGAAPAAARNDDHDHDHVHDHDDDSPGDPATDTNRPT